MSIVNSITPTIANGQTVDATVLTAMMVNIQSQVNSGACPATTTSSILKGDGAGATTPAVAGTDFVTVAQLAVVTLPSGVIMQTAASTAPSGWLTCDGSAISRTVYAALFTAIGTVWGAGDGSTTFNLPSFVDRTPIGAGTIASLGAYGGSKDATLVSHNHGVNDPNHNHGVNDPSHSHVVQLGAVQASGTAPGGGFGPYNTTYNNQATQSAATGVSIQNAGSSATNANLPPYSGVNFIIKT